MMNDLIQNNLMDLLELAIGTVMFVASLFFTGATFRLPAKWRMEAEAARQIAEEKMRVGLHQAAVTGVENATKAGLTGRAAITFALKHVIKSVPELIIGLTPTPKEIFESNSADVVLAKLPPKIREVLENIVVAKMGGASGSEIASGVIASQLPALQEKIEGVAREAINKAIGDNLNFGRGSQQPVGMPPNVTSGGRPSVKD